MSGVFHKSVLEACGSHVDNYSRLGPGTLKGFFVTKFAQFKSLNVKH